MQGFVMALDYSDQMTGSSANVMNLQCFIGHHVKGVKVIEPFIHPKGSLFGVSLSPSYTMSQGYKLKLEEINSVKLSDVLDINEYGSTMLVQEGIHHLSAGATVQRTVTKS